MSVLTAAAEIDHNIKAELARFASTWNEPIEKDSRFGIRSVAQLLNLDLPSLSAVRESYLRGDYAACERCLLDHFRNRFLSQDTRHKRLLNGKTPDLTIANDALRHVFRGNGKVHPPVFRGVKIDWTQPAIVNNAVIHDNEWLLQYHRLTWWPALAQAYQATLDEAYFNEWRFELVSYATENLPIKKQDPPFLSRGMEVGARCNSIAKTLPIFVHAPNFDSKLLLYALQSLHLQVEHLRTVYAAKMNHRLSDLSDVFRMGVEFPEFRKSTEWKNEAADLLPRIMFDDVYSDGMNKEVVFSYHGMYIRLFSQAYRMFQENGYADRIPPDFYKRLVSMAEIYAHAILPDSTLPQFGDGWKGGGNAGRLLANELSFAKADIPFMDFIATRGENGIPPARSSIAFPISGFYFFRSSWDLNSTYMVIKSTEEAEWHNQYDNGTFELHAMGRSFMVDSGCYIYGSQSKEEQRLREWFRSTKAHQTLTLNDSNSNRKPRFVSWHESPLAKAVIFENLCHENLLHRRTVLFIENSWFLMHDEALGAAEGEVAIHFQLVPCDYAQEGATVTTKFSGGPNLTVRNFPVENAPQYKSEEGWISYEILKRQTRPAWKWSLNKIANRKVDFLTALVPTDGEKAEVSDGVVRTTPTEVVYTICNKGATYVISLQKGGTGITLQKR